MTLLKQVAAVCMAALMAAGSAQAQTPFEQSAKMARGVNIIGYDTALWRDHTQGRFKQRYFKMLKEAGFSSVRLNLHPFSHMDASNTISPQWLATLDWAVAQSLAAGLMPVLDLHEFGAMAENLEGNKPKLLAAWRQLAQRYRDQPSDVVFELLNEPNGQLTDQLWNGLLLETLAVVRASNPTRTVIIGPGHWNGINSLAQLELPEWDRNLIVTVHFYEPMRFTHQGASWTEEFKNLSGVSWTGSEEERRIIDSRLQQAADWARVHNRPLYLGEFGAYDKADMASRARWTAHVARSAEKLGASWAYWQFDSDFVLYDINKDAWTTPILQALAPGR
ncbi:cellulase family glycosylhydrolase [Duganella sp. FT80W]|uniref:Cellulase family glycosylhydrolase n=1 Tax=Duganella guangzhouensis TaxID=2666084 RepID=A0A6I2LA83_9BURK|nr:glycoside hydrolase family 5 protein [Duganella guangzhouensis]MRW94753.1 cellulase family glycosylhydrolase [Duganella guangzhouensis]